MKLKGQGRTQRSEDDERCSENGGRSNEDEERRLKLKKIPKDNKKTQMNYVGIFTRYWNDMTFEELGITLKDHFKFHIDLKNV